MLNEFKFKTHHDFNLKHTIMVKKPHNSSNDHASFVKEITKIKADASSIRGPDAKLIVLACNNLKERIQSSKITTKEKKKLIFDVTVLIEESESEERMEACCAKILQRGILFMTFGPMLLSLLGTIGERITRPNMSFEERSLTHTRAIVTGGCGDLGSRLVVKLAESGCNVIAACRSTPLLEGSMENNNSNEGEQEEKFLNHYSTRFQQFEEKKKKKIEEEEDEEEEVKEEEKKIGGSIQVWKLDLTSFASVEDFSARYHNSEKSLDMLIHAAAVREEESEGCTTTMDGYDTTIQTNYLRYVDISFISQ